MCVYIVQHSYCRSSVRIAALEIFDSIEAAKQYVLSRLMNVMYNIMDEGDALLYEYKDESDEYGCYEIIKYSVRTMVDDGRSM